MTGATGPAVGAGAGLYNVLHNPDQKKRTLTLKSLLKCLNVGLRLFALIFSMNIVCLMDSSFFKVFLYVAKILHNKLSDLISAFYPLVYLQGCCAQPRSIL